MPGRPGRDRAAVALAALALCAAACGGAGRMDAAALSRQAEALSSPAAEGAVLAGDAADGRSTGVFVREHASDLERAAATIARSLADASADPPLEPARRRLAGLAGSVRADLARIGGASAAEQRAIARRLAAAAAAGRRIGAHPG